MPIRPKLPCRKLNCKELVPAGQGYCSKHQTEYNRQVKERRTDKEYSKFYSTIEWKRLRNLKLQMNPLCERCEKQGRTTIATIVHHIEEIREGGDRLPTLEELESICKPCHSKHHGGWK